MCGGEPVRGEPVHMAGSIEPASRALVISLRLQRHFPDRARLPRLRGERSTTSSFICGCEATRSNHSTLLSNIGGPATELVERSRSTTGLSPCTTRAIGHRPLPCTAKSPRHDERDIRSRPGTLSNTPSSETSRMAVAAIHRSASCTFWPSARPTRSQSTRNCAHTCISRSSG
jgi:hypothetical protein